MTTVQERYDRDLPAWLRAIGCWGYQRPTYRFSWGEFTPRRGLAVSYKPQRYVHLHLIWGSLFINVPNRAEDYDIDGPSYGFSLVDRGVHLHWGKWFKIWHLPWDWVHIRHSVRRADGRWEPYRPDWRPEGGRDSREWFEAPYTYVRRNGDIQRVTARFYVDQMEWRWRWLRFSPFPRKVKTCISVEFSGEIGERTGTWKGGVVGCGYEMHGHETALQTLRRMERERKFN